MARIVIAEDQAHIRHILMMWLGKHGHEVVEATNGRAALEALSKAPADLLITDVNMPEMDGIALTHRAFEVCPSLRHIFVVTSRCDQHEIVAQVEAHRVTVIPKPFSPKQLIKDVETVCQPLPVASIAN